MTVTIHLPPGAAAARMVLSRLVALAGGDRRAVRSGNTGLVVSDELALAYLTVATGYGQPPANGQPTASDGQISRAPMPPNLAAVVRKAEHTGGLTQPAQAAEEPPARKTTRPAARRPRRTEQGAST